MRWYIATMTRRELLAISSLAPLAIAEGNESILGSGWGLDHIEVAVSDPKAARDMYQNLGFTLSRAVAAAAGVEHSAIFFEPAYIEFIWFGGAGEPDTGRASYRQLRRAVDAGGGIFQYNIDASPIQGAADMLRMRGLNVRLPQAAPRIIDGKETPAPWQFMFATEERNAPVIGVPGGDGVGFIEYRNNSVTRRKPTDHSNTARRLLSVFVAVPDVAAAQKECGRLGFKPLDQRQSSALGARGREVQCGTGSITFWEPSGESSTLGVLLKQKGPGPFGFSVGVASLQTAHQLVEQGTHKNLRIESRSGHKSFTVPGELTGGLWVEFLQ
jgi:catechol 2,3-dioxygenase-like lactoylglutathione lyase family enzyme